jgi:hypothetical protein
MLREERPIGDQWIFGGQDQDPGESERQQNRDRGGE